VCHKKTGGATEIASGRAMGRICDSVTACVNKTGSPAQHFISGDGAPELQNLRQDAKRCRSAVPPARNTKFYRIRLNRAFNGNTKIETRSAVMKPEKLGARM